jgi:ribonucleotide reductase alpha subunit
MPKYSILIKTVKKKNYRNSMLLVILYIGSDIYSISTIEKIYKFIFFTAVYFKNKKNLDQNC